MLSATLSTSEIDRLLIERAVLQAVVYADIFDYPLTLAEVHRYLVGVSASPVAIEDAIRNAARGSRWWLYHRGYVTLTNREALITTRRQRAQQAAVLWPKALRYGHMIANLPFVRMVAVTGALAVDNVQSGADIDYLIVVEPGRLWLCRALTIAVVRFAALSDDIVCPNYLISLRALTLRERSLYTAHELTQMVPITGLAIYEQMRRLNSWTDEFLPNADGAPRHIQLASRYHGMPRRVAEAVLRTPVGGWLERQEMTRKVRKLQRQRGSNVETDFCEDWCKGHFEAHGQHTLATFDKRLREVMRDT